MIGEHITSFLCDKNRPSYTLLRKGFISDLKQFLNITQEDDINTMYILQKICFIMKNNFINIFSLYTRSSISSRSQSQAYIYI
jgi:hypothetical protein